MSLRRGQKFEMGGLRFRVTMVNDCRARAVAEHKVPQSRVDRTTGEVRTFTATRRIVIDISPNSGVELLGGSR